MKDIYRNKLKILAEDNSMLEALAAIFNRRIEIEKPIIGKVENNRLIGEKYRAYDVAKKLLNQILIDIENYKEERQDKIKFNKGK